MVSEKSLSFRRRVSRLTVECTECRQVWLAPGLACGDEYECKECGAVLVKRGAGASPRRRDIPCSRRPECAG